LKQARQLRAPSEAGGFVAAPEAPQMSIAPRQRTILAVIAILATIGTLAFFRGRPADAELAPDTLAADSLAAAAATPEERETEDSAVEEDATTAEEGGTSPGTEAREVGSSGRYRAGEDPDYAERMGWPVSGPAPRAGSILPDNRIVCYYGNPNSTRMGALGEFPKDDMLRRLRRQADEWRQADPSTPVTPCLHMVAVVAQGEPGTTGHYRSIMRDADVQKVYDWANEIGGIFIVDIQVGTDDIRRILPRFEWILKQPNVHLGVDPEFYMKGGERPGSRIGTMDAADINYAAEYLAKLVGEHDLPPKVLVVHRFTQRMVTNADRIRLDPRVQIVMHMDGWGPAWLKRDSYRDYVVKEPVQFAGFKIFYHNDTKAGDPLMTPADMLRLRPQPLYIQYQ
jgi:hypothetical protein